MDQRSRKNIIIFSSQNMQKYLSFHFSKILKKHFEIKI